MLTLSMLTFLYGRIQLCIWKILGVWGWKCLVVQSFLRTWSNCWTGSIRLDNVLTGWQNQNRNECKMICSLPFLQTNRTRRIGKHGVEEFYVKIVFLQDKRLLEWLIWQVKFDSLSAVPVWSTFNGTVFVNCALERIFCLLWTLTVSMYSNTDKPWPIPDWLTVTCVSLSYWVCHAWVNIT